MKKKACNQGRNVRISNHQVYFIKNAKDKKKVVDSSWEIRTTFMI